MRSGIYTNDHSLIPWDQLTKDKLVNIENNTLLHLDKELEGSLVIPKTINKIEKYACKDCNIEGIFPKSTIEKIGNNAFEDCKTLTTFSGIEKTSKIGRYAFNGCINFCLPTRPLTADYIGTKAFHESNIFVAIFEKEGKIEKDAFDNYVLLTFLEEKKSIQANSLTDFFSEETLDSLIIQYKTFKEINKYFKEEENIR